MITQVKLFKKVMSFHIDEMNKIVDDMPYKGDKCTDSQQMCLKQRLKELEAYIYGTTQKDLEQNKIK